MVYVAVKRKGMIAMQTGKIGKTEHGFKGKKTVT
jgi:hypothetical protein